MDVRKDGRYAAAAEVVVLPTVIVCFLSRSASSYLDVLLGADGEQFVGSLIQQVPHSGYHDVVQQVRLIEKWLVRIKRTIKKKFGFIKCASVLVLSNSNFERSAARRFATLRCTTRGS